MKYGKLENGYIRYAPTTVIWQGHIVNNPDATKLKELGYLPIKHVDMPQDAPEGQHYESSWEETETEIIQTWILVENEPIPEPKPTIEEQILALQNALISQKISGGGITTITDSSDNRIKDFKLLGKSEQVTTKGLNLFNYKDFVDINTYADEGSNYRRKYLQLKPNTPYRMTIFNNRMSPSGDSLVMFIGDKETFDNINPNGSIVFFTSANKKSATITTKESGQIVFKLNKNSTPELQEEYLSQADIILSEGSTEIPYEPYTGDKPSPSPDYPQEIKSVGKWNETTGKYEVDVRISGKNLIGVYNIFDSKGIDASGNVIDKPNACISDLIMVQKGKCHTLSLNNADGITIVAYLYDKDRKYIGYYFATESLTREFTLDEDCFIRFVFSKPKAYILSTNIQLELQKGKSSYEPQREPQTIKLSLDQPLRGDGDFKDIVTKDGIVRNIAMEKNGTSSVFIDWIPERPFYRSTISLKNPAYSFKDLVCKCDQLTGVKIIKHYPNSLYVYYETHELEQMGIDPNGTHSDANIALKEYLSKNPLEIMYPLKYPISEPLPEDFKQALEKLSTYYPTTVITVDGGELDPDVEVTYIADTKNYIDQKIDSVVKTVVETQKALL